MKYIFHLFMISCIVSCSPSIHKTKTTISTEGKSDRCVEFIDFVKNNMFYVEADNSYLLSDDFSAIIQRRYIECMSELTFEEVISLFGKPSCKTENCVAYYFYQYIPKNTTYEELNMDPDNFIFAFKRDGNKCKRVNKCNCEK